MGTRTGDSRGDWERREDTDRRLLVRQRTSRATGVTVRCGTARTWVRVSRVVTIEQSSARWLVGMQRALPGWHERQPCAALGGDS